MQTKKKKTFAQLTKTKTPIQKIKCAQCNSLGPVDSIVQRYFFDGSVESFCSQACGTRFYVEDVLKRPAPIEPGRGRLWCPVCGDFIFQRSRHLAEVFGRQSPEYHAACLVTHYRHGHIVSHDRAWKNHNYASKIPGYIYDDYKEEVNNRAKRQILRALVRHHKKNTIPKSVDAVRLAKAFRKLQFNDRKTYELIAQTVTKLT